MNHHYVCTYEVFCFGYRLKDLKYTSNLFVMPKIGYQGLTNPNCFSNEKIMHYESEIQTEESIS